MLHSDQKDGNMEESLKNLEADDTSQQKYDPNKELVYFHSVLLCINRLCTILIFCVTLITASNASQRISGRTRKSRASEKFQAF